MRTTISTGVVVPSVSSGTDPSLTTLDIRSVLRGDGAPPGDFPEARSRWGRLGLVLGLVLGLALGLALGAVASPSVLEAQTYRVYVANESSDLLSRVAFSPGEGARVEAEIPVGMVPTEPDSPHGLAISPDGEFIYISLAHGTPFGYAWKLHAGPDTLVGRTTLGRFPASMGTTPDGSFLLVANFNLHGDMVPSDMSVVYTPTMTEVARVETCLMPHGSRVNSVGTRHYSTCMHSDQLVEFDLTTFQLSRRISLTPGWEGPVALDDAYWVGWYHTPEAGGHGGDHGGHGGHGAAHAGHGDAGPEAQRPPPPDRVCSPTWASPGKGSRLDRVVYVACNALDEVLEVDVESGEVLRRFATGRGPYNLEPTPDGELLVVSLKAGQGVSIIHLGEGREVARVETSRAITHGVAISPDGRFAFITNESIGSLRGSLDVIDLGSMERVSWVELRHQPGGIDFWRMTEN